MTDTSRPTPRPVRKPYAPPRLLEQGKVAAVTLQGPTPTATPTSTPIGSAVATFFDEF